MAMTSIPESRPTALDLFAGIGGLSLGLTRAGFQVLGAVEWDRELAATYECAHARRRHKPKVLVDDVRKIDPQELMDSLGLRAGDLTLTAGGPPCQGFSSIGKRRLDDERNELIFEFVRFLSVFKSEYFLIENVPGLNQTDRKATLNRLLDELRSIGYANATYEVVDAARFGVPQRRLRIAICGSRTGPLPVFNEHEIEGTVSVFDAIGDLPSPKTAPSDARRIPYGRAKPSDYALAMRGDASSVSHWQPVKHSPEVIDAYSKVTPGHTDPATRCWRLKADDVARTLRAGSKTGTACRPIHYEEARVITVREAARIHSFPDSYPLPEAKATAHLGIGNSVPPLLGQALGLAFLTAIKKGEQAHNEAAA